jgi:hypothetical protein
LTPNVTFVRFIKHYENMPEITKAKRYTGKAVTRSFSLPDDMDRAAMRKARLLFHGNRVGSLYYRSLIARDLDGSSDPAHHQNGKAPK